MLDGDVLVDFEELVPPAGSPKTGRQPKRLQIPVPVQSELLQSLSRFLNGKFRLIQAARNMTASPSRFGDRASFMQTSTEGELVAQGQSLERDQQEKWSSIEEFVTAISPNIQDVRIISSQIHVKERGTNTRLPVSLIGGGHQEIFSLAHELKKGPYFVYGLEEPEQHLHPELAREFFDTLKTLSKDNQVFLTTHSTIFVDKAELSSTWIVRREKADRSC